MFEEGSYGILRMATEPFASAARDITWVSTPVVSTLILISIILLALSSRDFGAILPQALESVFYWKQGIKIQENLHATQARRMTAISLILPFCLISVYYAPEFISRFSLPFFALSYFLVKEVVGRSHTPAGASGKICKATRYTTVTLFIPLTLLMLATVVLGAIPGITDMAVSIAIAAELALTFLIQIAREWEILRSASGALPTFLYLCALEILPSAAAVAAAYAISQTSL